MLIVENIRFSFFFLKNKASCMNCYFIFGDLKLFGEEISVSISDFQVNLTWGPLFLSNDIIDFFFLHIIHWYKFDVMSQSSASQELYEQDKVTEDTPLSYKDFWNYFSSFFSISLCSSNNIQLILAFSSCSANEPMKNL